MASAAFEARADIWIFVCISALGSHCTCHCLCVRAQNECNAVAPRLIDYHKGCSPSDSTDCPKAMSRVFWEIVFSPPS